MLVFSQFTNAAASYHVIFAAGWLGVPVHAPATTLVSPPAVALVIASSGISYVPIRYS
jgi:hypothetical protein